MSELKIDHKAEGGVGVCRIEGRLDAHGAVAMETYAQQRIGAGEARLVLDLTGVDYVSSAGLRCLMVTAKKAQSVNGCLVLCCLTPMVLNVLTLSGFDQLLKIRGTTEEAVAAAAAHG
ncbi:MAG: STAS domain-containing protein [Verrucomicrobiota bacterium]|nr:STAS domain-containing protein [Verrucomicrobiota bacterium]